MYRALRDAWEVTHAERCGKYEPVNGPDGREWGRVSWPHRGDCAHPPPPILWPLYAPPRSTQAEVDAIEKPLHGEFTKRDGTTTTEWVATSGSGATYGCAVPSASEGTEVVGWVDEAGGLYSLEEIAEYGRSGLLWPLYRGNDRCPSCGGTDPTVNTISDGLVCTHRWHSVSDETEVL